MEGQRRVTKGRRDRERVKGQRDGGTEESNKGRRDGER
jgi:hypothetical protein